MNKEKNKHEEDGSDSGYFDSVLTNSEKITNEFEAKRKRRSAIIWSKLSITGYVWDIIRNIIVVFIVALIYGSVYGSFETIITSLLILIYLSVVSYSAILAQTSERNILQTYYQGVETRKRLMDKANLESYKFEIETDEDEFEKAGFILEKVMYKFYINSSFNFIIFIIVIFNLIGAI